MPEKQNLETMAQTGIWTESLQSSQSQQNLDLIKRVVDIAATGIIIGTMVGGCLYFKGKWPFYRNKKNSYALIESKIGEPIRAMKPYKTGWLVWPFANLIKDDDEPFTIPSTIEGIKKEGEIYLANGNTAGGFTLEISLRIPTERDAVKFYTRTNADISKIEGMFRDRLANSFSQRLGTSEILLDGEYQKEIKKEFNEQRESLYGLNGILTEGIYIYNLIPSEESLRIMRIPITAELKAQREKLSSITKVENVREIYLPLIKEKMPEETPKTQMNFAIRLSEMEYGRGLAENKGQNVVIFKAA